MDIVRIGIVGLGNMGSVHFSNILEGYVKNAKITALCDTRKERLEWAKEKCDAHLYTDYAKMLSSKDFDAVIIAVPHPLHSAFAVKAFESGYHVMVEKPEAVSVSEALLMNKAADKSGKVFGIMFNQRTNPLFIKAREMVKSGKIGTPDRLTYIITNWYRTQRYYDTGAWRATWLGEGGGVLMNQAPHNLDILQWIFGMPDSLTAFCDVSKYHNIEVEDCASIFMKYKSGARAQFITSTGEYPGTNRLEITGTKGKIVIESGKLKSYLLGFDEMDYRFSSDRSSCSDAPEYSEYIPDEKESAHIGVLNSFVMKILGCGELVANGREGINELSISNAAYLSAWTEREVPLDFDVSEFDRLLDERKAKSSFKKTEISSPENENSKRWEIKW